VIGVRCSTAYSSSCAPALRGLIFEIVILPTRLAIAAVQQWVRSGIMRGILEAVAGELRLRGGFHREEAFIDGSLRPG